MENDVVPLATGEITTPLATPVTKEGPPDVIGGDELGIILDNPVVKVGKDFFSIV